MSDWIPLKGQNCRHCDEPMEIMRMHIGSEHMPVTQYRHQGTKQACCYVRVGAEPKDHDKARAEAVEAETPKAISTAALYEQFAKMPPIKR